jgi:hypothetical protein
MSAVEQRVGFWSQLSNQQQANRERFHTISGVHRPSLSRIR